MEYYEKGLVTANQVAGSCEVRNRELIPNLKAQRNELTLRINKIDQLLQILEKNPDFVRMFDLTRELI